MEIICQSCGMPMRAKEHFGSNADGSKNDDYCAGCYQEGVFTRDMTMDEMIETNLQYLDEWNKDADHTWTVDEARQELTRLLPLLKRWGQ